MVREEASRRAVRWRVADSMMLRKGLSGSLDLKCTSDGVRLAVPGSRGLETSERWTRLRSQCMHLRISLASSTHAR